MLVTGRIAQLLLLLLISALTLFFVQRSRKGKVPKIRSLAGLDAIYEAVSRAVEMGKPVHFTGGYARMTGLVNPEAAPQMLASLGILHHVARLSARLKAQLIVTLAHPELIPLYEDVMHSAYVVEGKPEEFKKESIHFLSAHQFAYAIGVMELITREQVASNLMFGYFLAESLIFSEVGAVQGCFQVAGTGSTLQLPFFVVTCDYTLIGEEIFAATAYVTKDPVLLGAIAAQDVSKMVTCFLIICAVALATLKINLLVQLLRT